MNARHLLKSCYWWKMTYSKPRFSNFSRGSGGKFSKFLKIVSHFIIAYHISLVKVQDKYWNNNILILNVKHLNKIIKLHYFKSTVGWLG